VAATLRHIGLTVYTPKGSDIEGLAEAVKKGCDLIFAADDKVFAALNPQKMRVVENSEATGWAYAAALELKAGNLEGKPVAVVGAGRVGSAAVNYLTRRRAKCHLFDAALEKTERLKVLYPEHVTICNSLQECLKEAKLIILAAPGVNLPTALVKRDTVVSAPAIPLGLTGGALRKLSRDNLIHDPLQLGVATMAVAALKD
jgi:pyrrolysine biosynthesis protein PylD